MGGLKIEGPLYLYPVISYGNIQTYFIVSPAKSYSLVMVILEPELLFGWLSALALESAGLLNAVETDALVVLIG